MSDIVSTSRQLLEKFIRELRKLATYAKNLCLNVMYITNQEFANRAMETFNPHNSMIISANDGLLNSQVNLYKDILITSNDLLGLSRDAYTDEDKAEIEAILAEVD